MAKPIDLIFNILLSKKPLMLSRKSASLALNIQSFKNCYPDAKYQLFDNRRVRAFLQRHFEKAVLETYDTLIPFAFKADLARYCILYVQGGVYSDISHLHLNPIQIDHSVSLVVFRDVAFIHQPQSISNAVIFAEAGEQNLYQLIQKILEHANQRYYGQSPLEPTGPYLLGRHLASLEDYRGMVFGDSTAITVGANPANSKKHIMKFMPNGDLIAYRNKRTDASVDEFIEGGNSYATLWKQRRVYQE